MIKGWIFALAILAATPACAVDFYFVADYATPQAAIDAAEAAGGGVVRFPCGTVNLSSGLVVDQRGVTLEGCGPQGTVLSAGFATGDIIKLGNTTTPFSPCGGVRDLSIVSSVTRTSGYAIAVAGCEQGVLENLRIATQGGHGLRFSDSNDVLAAIFFVSALDIEIQGAFTAIRIDGSLERHFANLWLRGTSAAGSSGIVITATGGDWFDDIDTVLFETGVHVVPPSGKFVGWIDFENVLTDTNSLYGFRFSGAGTISGISCIRCWASTNGHTSVNGRGVLIETGNGLTFTDPRVINNGGHGFEVASGPADIAISGGIFAGNCQASGCTNGLAHGIVLTGTSGFRISGVRAGQALGMSNKQGYGIFINTGCDNYIVSGNDTRLNLTGGIRNVPGTNTSSRFMEANICAPYSCG